MLQKSTTRKNSKVSAVCIASSKELNANSNLGLTSTPSSRMKKRSRLRWMGVRYSITNQSERSTFLDKDRCFSPALILASYLLLSSHPAHPFNCPDLNCPDKIATRSVHIAHFVGIN